MIIVTNAGKEIKKKNTKGDLCLEYAREDETVPSFARPGQETVPSLYKRKCWCQWIDLHSFF